MNAARPQFPLPEQPQGIQPATKLIFLVLQKKGGVGKTVVSRLLSELLVEAGIPVTIVDADPLTPNLAKYAGLEVTPLDLMHDENRDDLDPGKFDELVEMIANTDTHFVIDTGSGSFQPLISYLKENRTLALLQDTLGCQVVITPVITGGPECHATLTGFAEILENFTPEEGGQAPRILVWLNAYKGDVKLKDVPFHRLEIFQNNRDRIDGVIVLRRWTGATFGKDVNIMLEQHVLFQEFLCSGHYKLASKSRVARFRQEVFQQFANLPLFSFLPPQFVADLSAPLAALPAGTSTIP